MATAQKYTDEQFAEWNELLEGKTPQEIITWAAKEFQPGLTMACSFGGPSGMVLLDMIAAIDSSVEIFYLDTDFLFPETYATIDKVIERYGMMPIGYKSKLTPEDGSSCRIIRPNWKGDSAPTRSITFLPTYPNRWITRCFAIYRTAHVRTGLGNGPFLDQSVVFGRRFVTGPAGADSPGAKATLKRDQIPVVDVLEANTIA